MARCPSVREVENPNAPARNASSTMWRMASMSCDPAGSLRAPRSPMT